MHILTTILNELAKQNKTQKDLCDHLQIKNQAFSDWKSGKSRSYQKYLPQIAEYLNVPIDFLLGKELQPTNPYNLSIDEQAEVEEIIANYRACDNAGKHKIVEVSRIEAQAFQQKRKDS